MTTQGATIRRYSTFEIAPTLLSIWFVFFGLLVVLTLIYSAGDIVEAISFAVQNTAPILLLSIPVWHLTGRLKWPARRFVLFVGVWTYGTVMGLSYVVGST